MAASLLASVVRAIPADEMDAAADDETADGIAGRNCREIVLPRKDNCGSHGSDSDPAGVAPCAAFAESAHVSTSTRVEMSLSNPR